jgi:hypothetical protein
VRTLVLIVACAAVAWAAPLWAQEEEEADPPQVAIGERLFLETLSRSISRRIRGAT